jgi:dienelactone hydrolase
MSAGDADTLRAFDTDGDWKDRLPRALSSSAVRARLAVDESRKYCVFDDLASDLSLDAFDRGWTEDGRWGGGVPTLLAHPEDGWWRDDASPTPAPLMLWFHGRTVEKELDPGRYLRWKRMGVATCAIDLPGHGERRGPSELHTARSTLRIAEIAAAEIDAVLTELADDRFRGAFDLDRIAIGGMSAGGMTTLIRLTREGGTRYSWDGGPCGTFRAAVLEAAAGDFRVMEGHDFFVPERVDRLNPIDHLDRVDDIVPTLAVHSSLDEWVPAEGITRFIDALSARYAELGGSPDDARVHLWDRTGAPYEHMGFGAKTNDTKDMENAFLAERLGVA